MEDEIAYERYSRQILLKGFGEAGQKKLLSAKVVVIGAGGLGCPALQYLVAAGVGTIGIVDDDVVSLSNLHRQVLYTTADIGALKVDKATIKLQELNSGVKIIPYRVRLEKENALGILSYYDLVIDGTDNFATRYLINDACGLLKKPLIYGAVSQYEGQLAVFNAGDKSAAVTYRDLFPQPPKDGEVANCAEAGVLGVLPGIIGTMQATEAIKLITGIGEPLVNKLLTYNALRNEVYKISITPSSIAKEMIPKNEAAFLKMKYDDRCAPKQPTVTEIDALEFMRLQNEPSAITIDVREMGELPLLTGINYQQIPMSVFKERFQDIQQQTVLLFCQHGIRSLHAAELVQDAFGGLKNIYSLKGGVAKWGSELGAVGSSG